MRFLLSAARSFVLGLGLSCSCSCGGNVVVDASGSASTGDSSSATGPAADCASLLHAYKAELALARACDPTSNMKQCTGVVHEACTCDKPVDEGGQNAAQAAYDAWRAAGCGPPACGAFCAGPLVGVCQAQEDGTGVCMGVIVD